MHKTSPVELSCSAMRAERAGPVSEALSAVLGPKKGPPCFLVCGGVSWTQNQVECGSSAQPPAPITPL